MSICFVINKDKLLNFIEIQIQIFADIAAYLQNSVYSIKRKTTLKNSHTLKQKKKKRKKKGFIVLPYFRFAKPDILKSYVLLMADFQKNSSHTNHCCVKMLHRMAFDLGCVGMVFQASLFRVFQKILLSPLAKSERYKVLLKSGKKLDT